MSHNNDIVLIDSSSDEDEVQQNAKRFKPDPELNTYSNNKSNNGKFSIAPFQEVSSSSSSENEDEDEDTYGDSIQHPIMLVDSNNTPRESQNGGDDDDGDDDGDDSEGLTRTSNRAPLASEITLEHEPIYISSGDSDNDEYDSSSSDDLEPNFDFEDVPPEVVAETRKYLKAHGNIKFLENIYPQQHLSSI